MLPRLRRLRSAHASGRLAIKHHPDKNRDDPHAEERFKEIAIAYQTLSDPELRRKYNEFGSKESAPEGGFVDPEEIFGTIFGGERFLPIIGHISLAKDMKAALQEEEGEEEGGGGVGFAPAPAKTGGPSRGGLGEHEEGGVVDGEGEEDLYGYADEKGEDYGDWDAYEQEV